MIGMCIERSGFLIAVAITVMCAAAVVYYVNSRLRPIHDMLNKQSIALSQALACMRAGVGGGSLATESAIQAAAEYEKARTPNGLIPVSEDDSGSDDSSMSDYESDDAETTSDDECAGLQDVTMAHHSAPSEGAQETEPRAPCVENHQDPPPSTTRDILYDGVIPSFEVASDVESPGSSTESSAPDMALVELPTGDEVMVAKMDEAGDPLPAATSHDIRSMRVQQLRDLAISRNSAPEDEVKGMKKGELVQLLLDE